MWWRVPCLRPQQFAVQRAWKSTRRSIKPPKSSLFESTPAPFLPRPSTPIFHLSEPRIPTHVRFGTCLVAFAAGFSIYLFLDDPEIVGPPPKLPVLSPSQFVVTKLTSTEASGPDTKLVKIAAPPHLLPLTESNDASIWSVFIKDDDIQVERAYTPLHGVDSKGDMLFWIKKYPKGEVGRWIHSKNAGDKIEIRGPIKTWPWKDGLWDEVVMVSGGTGITSFAQLFNTVISQSWATTNTRFTLIHSSRVPGELPPAVILEPMVAFASANPDKFKLHVFVDEIDASKPPVSIEKINTGRIQEAGLKRCLKGPQEPSKSWWSKSPAQPLQQSNRPRILFLVCGPEPMIDAIAGPYGRNFSQGPVGGILGKMGYTSDEVYKL